MFEPPPPICISLMEVLEERKLKLSRKKSRMGEISKSFHFLGIDYPGTQPQAISKVAQELNDDQMAPVLQTIRGKPLNEHIHGEPVCIRPQAWTIRKD